MNDSIPQPARWYQFTPQGMLLVVLVVAAFFAGRDVAHRESMSEVSSLLKRLQAFDASRKPKPLSPRAATRAAISFGVW